MRSEAEKIDVDDIITKLRDRAEGNLVWVKDKSLLSQAALLLEAYSDSVESTNKIAPKKAQKTPQEYVEKAITSIYRSTNSRVGCVYVTWESKHSGGMPKILSTSITLESGSVNA